MAEQTLLPLDDDVLFRRLPVQPLRDITPSAAVTTSSAKAAHPAANLVDGSVQTFWQSDGVQPHTITLAFAKLTHVAALRVFLNHREDDSYTPHELLISAGPDANALVRVCVVRSANPVGWVTIPLHDKISGSTVLTLPTPEPELEALLQATNFSSSIGTFGPNTGREPNAGREPSVHNSMGTSGPNTARETARESMLDSLQSSSSSLLSSGSLRRKSIVHNTHKPLVEGLARAIVDPLRTYVVQITVLSNHQNGKDCHVRLVQALSTPQYDTLAIKGFPPFSSQEFRACPLTLR